ncbi:MAG: pilus assembly protein TadG-related protein, partial [Candidatus Binatia bacterium]
MKELDDKGQIFIFFTLAFVLLGLFIGLAVDGGRAYFLKAQLARQVDPAALAAAAKIGVSSSAAQEAACDTAKMNGLDCSNLTVTPETVTDPEGKPVDGVRVTASAPMPTTFMRLGLLIGCGTVCESINIAATAVAAPGGTFDLVMDLDDTTSMYGAKLSAAKSGAHTLVDALLPGGGSSSALVSLVPFRGCYNGAGTNNCKDADEYSAGDIVSLTSDGTKLHNAINALDAAGKSGTNVCEGLKRTRQELFESGVARLTGAKFIVILTDADNSYNESKAGLYVSAACKPSASAKAPSDQNRDLGSKTYSLASDIKSGATGDGQNGAPVTIFVIVYGVGASGPFPTACDPSMISDSKH